MVQLIDNFVGGWQKNLKQHIEEQAVRKEDRHRLRIKLWLQYTPYEKKKSLGRSCAQLSTSFVYYCLIKE